MLNDIFLMILSNTLSASIVALVVILLRIPMRRLPKIFSYVLWSAVIFKMLCPVSLASPVSMMNLFMDADSEIASSVTYVCNSYSRIIGAGTDMLVGETAGSAHSLFAGSWVELAARIWLIGAIVVFSNILTSYMTIMCTVGDGIRIMKNKNADIYESDSIPNAFVLGFANPKIYLPAGLSQKQIYAICEHEQVHVRRCDYLIKHLQYIALSLHWFNPLMWLCALMWCDDMECSCDEAVIRRQCRRLPEKDVKLNYSETLFALGSGGRPRLTTPVAFAECSTAARIRSVRSYRDTGAVRYIAWALLTLAMVLYLCLNPTVGAGSATAGLIYTETDGAIIVSGYEGNSTDIVIPARYRGRAVTGIAGQAFAGKGITSLTVTAGTLTVEQGAFAECHSLERVKINADSADIGALAFSECRTLSAVSITADELRLGSHAFVNCRSLTKASFEGESVYIGERAFSYCGALAQITADFDSVTLEEDAFDGCGCKPDFTVKH